MQICKMPTCKTEYTIDGRNHGLEVTSRGSSQYSEASNIKLHGNVSG